MRAARRIVPMGRLGVLLCGLCVAAGCARTRYVTTLTMPPQSLVSVHLSGPDPIILVENRGPGPVWLDAAGEPERLEVGTFRRRGLPPERTVSLATGPGLGAAVWIEALRVVGWTIEDEEGVREMRR